MRRKSKSKNFIIPVIISLCLIAAISLFIMLLNQPTFNVKEIMLVTDNGETKDVDFEYLNLKAPVNIFRVNLTGITKEIKKRHLEYEEVHIVRDFPSRLTVNVKMRKAVAQVRYGDYYLVDKEGIILSYGYKQKRPGEAEIVGVNLGPGPLRPGDKPESVSLQNALILLKKIKESRLNQKFNIDKIDAANYNNFLFFIDDIEVKLGPQDISAKLKLLEQILSEGKIDLKKVKYFDLRFEDVVIGPK